MEQFQIYKVANASCQCSSNDLLHLPPGLEGLEVYNTSQWDSGGDENKTDKVIKKSTFWGVGWLLVHDWLNIRSKGHDLSSFISWMEITAV